MRNNVEQFLFNLSQLEAVADIYQRKFLQNFAHQVVQEVRHLSESDFLSVEALAVLKDEERIRTVIREKNQRLEDASIQFIRDVNQHTSYILGGIKGTFFNNHLVLGPYKKTLVRRLFHIADKNQALALDRRSGGDGKYLAFIRLLALKVTETLNEDTLAGRSKVQTIGSVDNLSFNYGNNNENTYLDDLVRTLMILSREEFRLFIRLVVKTEVYGGAAEIVEEAVFGPAQTQVLEKVKREYHENGRPLPQFLQRVMDRLKPKVKGNRVLSPKEITLQELGLINSDGELNEGRLEEAIDLLENSPTPQDQQLAQKLRLFLN